MDGSESEPEPYTFQFHKGSIKTLARNLYVQRLVKFQFHKGSIKTFFILVSFYHKAISIP